MKKQRTGGTLFFSRIFKCDVRTHRTQQAIDSIVECEIYEKLKYANLQEMSLVQVETTIFLIVDTVAVTTVYEYSAISPFILHHQLYQCNSSQH